MLKGNYSVQVNDIILSFMVAGLSSRGPKLRPTNKN